jgi:glycosyltransferase involved in cell wall biosynthesis
VSRALSDLDDGSLVVLDGLVASGAPDLLDDHTSRLRVVVLVHLPMALGAPSAEAAGQEGRLLRSVAGVVTTSGWTRRWLIESHGLDEQRVHVAEPGVDEAGLAPGSRAGGELLCVAAVVPHKGQDLLLTALRRVVDLPWRCLCVGSTARDPVFAADAAREAEAAGLGSRFVLAGNRWGSELDASYAAADVLVLPSRTETYGLVVTEALARGLPVIAADVGGIREALGADGGGTRPGLLVPPDDAEALADALRSWLIDPDLRSRLRRAAAGRRPMLRSWTATAEDLSGVLENVA